MAKLKVGQRWLTRAGKEVRIIAPTFVGQWQVGETFYEADNGMIYRDHCSSRRGQIKHTFSDLSEASSDLIAIVSNW